MDNKSQYLYIQISDAILERIEAGELKPHERLSSERDLSEEFGVNRLTVRKALGMLVSQGVLYKVPSKGTFVAEPKLSQEMNVLVGLSDQLIRSGLQPGAKVLEISIVPAIRSVAKNLEVGEGTPVYYIHRVRYANREPIALERCYVPVQYYRGLETYDLENRSLYGIMGEEFGRPVRLARQGLEPVLATEDEARLLGISQPASLMMILRVGLDIDGVPVEYSKDLYRGDRSRFVFMTQNPNAAGGALRRT
ncbi:MAG: GntR family transcriptional regulator [Firmicutes bacterium]|nr:GntR family transcriptional regulator [Bacillota bacterium]